MGSSIEKWIDTQQRRQLPGWLRERKVTAARLSPRKKRDHKAARVIAARRYMNRCLASTAAHVRAVQRDGDDGMRCLDCHHIPLRPWEPVHTDWPCGCVDGTPEAEECALR